MQHWSMAIEIQRVVTTVDIETRRKHTGAFWSMCNILFLDLSAAVQFAKLNELCPGGLCYFMNICMLLSNKNSNYLSK